LKDIEVILEHLQLKNFVLIGHSLGGVIAAGILERRPKEVLGAVLVDTSPVSDEDVRNHLREQLLQGYRVYASEEEYSQWLQEKCPLVSWEIAKLLAQKCLLPLSSGAFRPKFDIDVAAGLSDGSEEQSQWTRLQYFEQPVLIVRGAGSAVLSRQVANDLLKKLPRGKLAIVEQSGHSVMNDNPLGFSNAVRPFLSQFRKIH
jgi:pimeloyl-ACP methyl ester carboxylesterase